MSSIVKLDLDDGLSQSYSHERSNEIKIAIIDLLENNSFLPEIDHPGPYHLGLSLEEGRLAFDIQDVQGVALYKFVLALSPFRRPIREYMSMCDCYYEAIRHSSPAQIETIDMGRRGLHEEGARLLTERLKGKVEMDWDTARRLFTLICALHLRS